MALRRLLSLASVFLLPRIARADVPAFYDSSDYNAGQFGPYAIQQYETTTVNSPVLNFLKPFTNCDDGSFLFISPRGHKANPMPYILDLDGSLIWTADRHYGEVYNFQTQFYRGQPYLTFWAGDDTVGGHGAGTYFMLDQHYDKFAEIHAGNNLDGDLHEMTITEQGTAIITIYNKAQTDLSIISDDYTADEKGWIWDSLFQEIHLETKEVLFQWAASDYLPLASSFEAIRDKGDYSDPWDWFHINSVEKDPQGNYLVSSRYLHAVLYISADTGTVLWQLGGFDNSFTDLSEGRATLFLGQHDARWTENYTAITLFDNRADWNSRIDDKSVGVRIDLDLHNMTAKLSQEYVRSEPNILAESQGSLVTLPNGNILLGYGYVGALTEFSPKGEVLCDAFLEPAANFGQGNVQSYRNFKQAWVGKPRSEPAVRVVGNVVYFSWLGATEVRSWSIHHADDENGEENEGYVVFTKVEKRGFEMGVRFFDVGRPKKWVKVLALDADGNTLGVSSSVLSAQDDTIWDAWVEQRSRDMLVLVALLVLGMVFTGFVLLLAFRGTWRRNVGRWPASKKSLLSVVRMSRDSNNAEQAPFLLDKYY